VVCADSYEWKQLFSFLFLELLQMRSEFLFVAVERNVEFTRCLDCMSVLDSYSNRASRKLSTSSGVVFGDISVRKYRNIFVSWKQVKAIYFIV